MNQVATAEHMDSLPSTIEGEVSKVKQRFSEFVEMLEDGVFEAELSDELNRINAALNDHAIDFAKTAKGKLSINFDFTLKEGVFEIKSDFKTKLPEIPRRRTIAWSTPDNNFSPSNPRQRDMFERSIPGRAARSL